MGSNGYIMHITYLNYVDISPAEPKKSIFRVCKTVKMTKIGKMSEKYFDQKIVIFPIFVIFTVLHTLKIDFFGSAGEIST